jgi:hypothetical protein
MRDLCADISSRLPELSHVDVEQVAFSFAQTRKPVMHGMQASLTPMRFEGGSLTGDYRGRQMTVQQVRNERGREMLYILTFYLPRFTNLDFHEKLVTVFHELWHVSPSFDGDLRRHPGRCYAHTGSQANYDAEMAKLADRWLNFEPAPSLYEFLQLDFAQLQQQYGRVFGNRIPRPRLLPVRP